MNHSHKKFNLEYKASFTTHDEKNEMRVWFVVPSSALGQKVESFSITPEPTSKYRDEQGNTILYFQVCNIKRFVICAHIQVTLWKYDEVKNERKVYNINDRKKSLWRYLRDEPFLEHTSDVKNLAHQLVSPGKTNVGIIRSLFLFIVTHFIYSYPVKKRGVRNLVLSALKGDCGEYSSLFVALCRFLKIPARNNTGFVIFPKQKIVTEHGWSSIYIKPIGWVEYDTQFASLEKNVSAGIQKYFGCRSDYRISFTNGFNIPLRPTIPRGFDLKYWNKRGLPLTHKSVQTLQPVVFVSRKQVRFKENIHILG